MCAIVASFDTDKLRELVKLNTYRGNHSWSFSLYSVDASTITITRGLGEIDLESLTVPEGYYGICHVQAPTTENRDKNSVHPATYINGDGDNTVHALWHNGIIKPAQIQALQQEFLTDQSWDTALVLQRLARTDSPGEIDGSFSCLWFKPFQPGQGQLILFRNEIAPMFFDEDMNLSSVRFDESYPTKPNTLLALDFHTKSMNAVGSFKTVDNPYYF